MKTTLQAISKSLPAEAFATAKGFSAVVSTETVDRDGDVMVAQGMNSRYYEANPVLLWGHADGDPPVGRCTAIRRRPSSIEMDFMLAPRPSGFVGEWRPDVLGGLIASKSLGAVSIRFRPLPGGVRKANGADVQKYGEDCEQVYSKWELLEVSLVSIPANQEALIYAVAKKAKAATMPAPAPRRAVIPVRVPLLGTDQIKGIVREELARASGKLWYTPR